MTVALLIAQLFVVLCVVATEILHVRRYTLHDFHNKKSAIETIAVVCKISTRCEKLPITKYGILWEK